MKNIENDTKFHPASLETGLSKQDILDRERADGEGMFEGKECPSIKNIKLDKKRSKKIRVAFFKTSFW